MLGTVFQIGIAPRRIDLLTGIDAVDFESAWNHRFMYSIDGFELPFLCRNDLLSNKRAVGRPKDLADVAWLLETEV